MKKIKRIIRTVLYKFNYYKIKNARLKGINMGGGGDKMPEFISIDADLNTDCDIVSYLESPIKYNDNSVEYIYNSHVVEHLSRKTVKGIISGWHRVLKPKGILFICVPDLEVLFNMYLENIKNYEKNKITADQVCSIVYGGQKDKYDFHYYGYSFTTMKYMLEELGFKNVKKFKHEDFEFLKHLQDAGNTAKVDGTSISLNIMAEK